jgi:hypothetical protein
VSKARRLRRCAPSSPPVGAMAKIPPRGGTLGVAIAKGAGAPSPRLGTGREGAPSMVYQGPAQLDDVGLRWRDLAVDQDDSHDRDHQDR